MKTWLQTATVGLDKAKEEIPFTYFFTDSDETGPITVFVDKKDNGETDVYKLHAKSGFITKEFNVSPEYIVDIKAISEKNIDNKSGEGETEETLARYPQNSTPPEREMQDIFV